MKVLRLILAALLLALAMALTSCAPSDENANQNQNQTLFEGNWRSVCEWDDFWGTYIDELAMFQGNQTGFQLYTYDIGDSACAGAATLSEDSGWFEFELVGDSVTTDTNEPIHLYNIYNPDGSILEKQAMFYGITYIKMGQELGPLDADGYPTTLWQSPWTKE